MEQTDKKAIENVEELEQKILLCSSAMRAVEGDINILKRIQKAETNIVSTALLCIIIVLALAFLMKIRVAILGLIGIGIFCVYVTELVIVKKIVVPKLSARIDRVLQPHLDTLDLIDPQYHTVTWLSRIYVLLTEGYGEAALNSPFESWEEYCQAASLEFLEIKREDSYTARMFLNEEQIRQHMK